MLAAVRSWWDDGRSAELAGLLPRLFFQHFGATSVVVHDGDALAAFLVGFPSPSGRDGRLSVHAITCAATTRSYAFHRLLAFSLSVPHPTTTARA